MNLPVPKIRTDTESSQVKPVPDSSRTGGHHPPERPVRPPPSLGGGQVGQGRPDRLDEIRQRKAERRRVRDAFQAARAHGLARRHAAKLRNLKTGEEAG